MLQRGGSVRFVVFGLEGFSKDLILRHSGVILMAIIAIGSVLGARAL
jgi:hypothetical protein